MWQRRSAAASHYNLVGGHNQLGNLALIVDGKIQYDLIVIQGAYHGMNVIFQNNILLNNDNIVMSADGADPSQSVNSGHNGASNEGAIENYGGDDSASCPGHLETDRKPAGRRHDIARSRTGQRHRRPWRPSARALRHWRLLRHQCGLADQHHLRRQRDVSAPEPAVGRSAGASSRRDRDAVGQHRKQPTDTTTRRLSTSIPMPHTSTGTIYTDCILVQAELMPADHRTRRQRRYRRAGD